MNKGIALSVLASALFALLYYFVTLMHPLNGYELFSWRIILVMPALALVISRAKAWPKIKSVKAKVLKDWRLAAGLLASSALLGYQLWLFVWAPVNQKALEVSLGYFLLPFSMVVVGRVFYSERLSRTQTIAIAIAALGVMHELYNVGYISWVTLSVMIGYPLYFMLRRSLPTGSSETLWFDMILMMPVSIIILMQRDYGLLGPFIENPLLLVSLPVMGVISSVALVAYMAASRLLPLGLFGILSYVEPLLLFIVAWLLLHEPVGMQDMFTYGPIWLAIMLVAWEGLLSLRRQVRYARRKEIEAGG